MYWVKNILTNFGFLSKHINSKPSVWLWLDNSLLDCYLWFLCRKVCFNLQKKHFGENGWKYSMCKDIVSYYQHRWELPSNYPVSTVVISIYHYVERIWRIIITPDFSYNIYNNEKYYPGEPVNIHIQSLINIIGVSIVKIVVSKFMSKLLLNCWIDNNLLIDLIEGR